MKIKYKFRDFKPESTWKREDIIVYEKPIDDMDASHLEEVGAKIGDKFKIANISYTDYGRWAYQYIVSLEGIAKFNCSAGSFKCYKNEN